MSDVAASALVISLIGAALIVTVIVPLVWAIRTGHLRQLAWVAAGLFGLPIAVLASMYYIGVPIILATMASGYALRKYGIWPYMVGGAVGLVIGGLFMLAVVSNGIDHGVFDGTLICLSVLAALFASAKLGVMLVAPREDAEASQPTPSVKSA